MKKVFRSLMLAFIFVLAFVLVGCSDKKDVKPVDPIVPPVVDPVDPVDPIVPPVVDPVEPKPEDNFPYEVNVAYKMMVFQSYTEINKSFYFKGEMAGFYFATSEIMTEGIDIYCEQVEGGYKLYFMSGEVKNYLGIKKSDDGKHTNAVFGADVNCTFVYDEEYKTVVTMVGEEKGYFYISTKPNSKGKVYSTISASTYKPNEHTAVAELVK